MVARFAENHLAESAASPLLRSVCKNWTSQATAPLYVSKRNEVQGAESAGKVLSS